MSDFDDRCEACGVSRQQILAFDAKRTDLIRRASSFVNAVAVLAENKTEALAWLADAALFVDEGTELAPRGSGEDTTT